MPPKRKGLLPAAVAAAAAAGAPPPPAAVEQPSTPHGSKGTRAKPSPRKRRRQAEEDEYEEDDFVVADDQDVEKPKRRRASKKEHKKADNDEGEQQVLKHGAAAAAATPEPDDEEKPHIMIEHSKTSTATCRTCQEKIKKGQIRFGVLGKSFRGGGGGGDDEIYRYFHSGCPPKSGVDDLSSIPGFSSLTEKDQASVEEQVKEAKAHKQHLAVGAGPGEDWPLPPSIAVTDALRERVRELSEKYEAMTKQGLHDVLMANASFVTGTKAELVARCVEGEALGAPPFPCPLCQPFLCASLLRRSAAATPQSVPAQFGRVGRATPGLASTMGGFEYTCRGWWDREADSGGNYHPCAYAVNAENLPRTPWAMPGGPGDRTEEVQHFSETKKRLREEAVQTIVGSAPPGWAEALASAPIKARMEAAVKLAEFASCKGLSIPEAIRTVEAGKALLNTKTPEGKLDPLAALEALAKHHVIHGGAQHPSNAGAAGVGGARGLPGVVAVVPENEPIAEELERRAEAEEDFFKKNAYRKAIPAIRNCSFQITSGDAVSKGKKKIAGVGKGIGAAIDAFLIRQHDRKVEETTAGQQAVGAVGAGGGAVGGSSAAAAAGKGEEMHNSD